MRPLALAFAALLALCLNAGASGPTTVKNDDSCDISHAPAATLLLPYFEVDVVDPAGETTIFSITNVGSTDQIVRVTLWTDLSYPVVTFNIYLTGYDVQSVNLYDVIARGIIQSPVQCGVEAPAPDPARIAQVIRAFVLGKSATCNLVGKPHENAVGFATIDVAGNCDHNNPTDPAYYTEDLRFLNVLLGDYQQVNSGQDFAQGNPMVHIRAIPGGGIPATRAVLPRYKSNLPRTFYQHFQDPSKPPVDARQPLPSTFATRWIDGGLGSFRTTFKIWRQSVSRAVTCADYAKNAAVAFTETVVFDPHENGEGLTVDECGFPICILPDSIYLPSTSRTSIADRKVFPQTITQVTIDGWIYFNLDDAHAGNDPLQGWIATSMRVEGRYSVDFDAAWLGNGCSPEFPASAYTAGAVVHNPGPQNPAAIFPGPAADINP